MIPHWNPSHENEPEEEDLGAVWDTLILDGMVMPGIPDVTISPEANLDDQAASGKAKGKPGDKGDKPASVSISLRLWTAEHLLAWEQAYARLWPKTTGGEHPAVGIVYPSAQLAGIDKIVISKIDLPKPGETWEIRMSAKEVQPAKEAKGLGTGSGSGGGCAALRAEAHGLRARAQAKLSEAQAQADAGNAGAAQSAATEFERLARAAQVAAARAERCAAGASTGPSDGAGDDL